MSEIALSLLLNGFVCPPVESAEVFYNGEYVICCSNGEPFPPVTMCGDRTERIDIGSDVEIRVSE